jgi:hypothetical protein
MLQTCRTLSLLLCFLPGLAFGQPQSASSKDNQPAKQDGKPCVSIDNAKEVLRLGRTLGYPDEEIVEEYGENPCATLSRLRRDAQSKTQAATPTFQTPAGATQEIEILKGKAWLSFDPKKWKEASSEAGRREFHHVNGDGYALVISERIQIPTEQLRAIALANAREAAGDVTVVEEQRRRVNGADLLLLRMEGHIKGIPFTYLGYYYGGSSGTIQLITYTGQNLFDEYRQDFENFLNGLRVQ